MQIFRKDQVIFLDDVALRVRRAIGASEVQLENASTGELSMHKSFNLYQAYEEGRLKTAAERKHELSDGVVRARPAARMTGMSDNAKAETRRRMDILIHLQRMGSFEKSRKGLREDLRLVAAIRGEARPPHESTVYRWRRKYLRAQQDVRALFVEFDKQGGKGGTRLDPAVEALIDEKIEAVFLGAKRGSAADVYDAVFLAIQLENAKRPEADHLAVPGLRTIQRRIADLYAFERAVAEFGHREAERRFASYGRARQVMRILEIVEIDHTPVDLMVTDDNRIVIGRPTLTIVLDRASRSVLGFHLSLAGHGVPAVFSALRHAMLPKTYLSKRYADLNLDWTCFGWPERMEKLCARSTDRTMCTGFQQGYTQSSARL
jgi:putative transposase